MQNVVDEARSQGAQVVVLLSHNGMDVDLKLAGRVSGIDAILAATRMTACRWPASVANRGGRTIVTNAGSNGKFLGGDRLRREGRAGWPTSATTLLPVFAEPAAGRPGDGRAGAQGARAVRSKLAEVLAVTEGTLYRRGNFNGSGDQLLLDALIEVRGAEIAFSPGFRWGTSLLAGQADHARVADGHDGHHLFVQHRHRDERRDAEDGAGDVADNLFNPDPYLPAGRRHGARGRPALRHRSHAADHGQAHHRHATRRPAHRGGTASTR
jgi:sulfur-oxidizing protein SoxB